MLRSKIPLFAAGLPLYAPPALVAGALYIGPDQQVGDVVDFVNAGLASSVYPPPSTVNTIFVSGASKGAPPYTITSADVTAGGLTVLQHTANAQGFSEQTSAAVNPITPPTAWDQGLIGGNAAGAVEFTRNQFLNNAGQAGAPLYTYQSTSVAYAGSYDSNGWPTSAFSVKISAGSGGLDGQLFVGTYQCSYRSAGQGTSLTGSAGCAVSGIRQDADGITTHFVLTISIIGSNASLDFNGGIQYLDIPRDGVTPTYGGPEFWSTALAYYAKFSTIRLMDVCSPNTGMEIVWADRLTGRAVEKGVTAPGLASGTYPYFYSWDRIFRLIAAIASYPGSRTKKFHLALPGLIDPAQPNSTNYAYQLATLMNTILGGYAIEIEWEVSDEPWNYTLSVIPGKNLHAALTELKCITLAGTGGGSYATDGNPVVSSVVSNGDGTVTVTTTQPLNAIQNADGSTFAITNGLGVVVNNQQSNGTWGAGSITQNANPLLNATVVTVPVTVSNPTGTTFKYACAGGSLTSGTACPVSGMAFFFNQSSNLVLDGLSLNLYTIARKVQTRRLYQVSQVWKSVRPQDNFVYNIQNSGFAASSIQAEYSYGQYIAGTTTPWAYASSLAPYVNPTVTGIGASVGNSFLTNVPFVATAQVGDAILVAGAGASGGTLSTTVAAGSSGTTLNIATPVLTSVASTSVTVPTGPQANFTGYIVGTTLTVTSTSSGTVTAGMMFNGTPATMAFGTKIISGSGTTFTVNIAQNVGSSASPVSMVAANTDGVVGAMMAALPYFTTALQAHIYQATLFGLRPMCYEGGPATEFSPAPQQIAIHTNPLIGNVVTGLLDGWVSQGGKEFQAYGIGPSYITNTTEGAWPFLQDFSDLTSPKIAAMLGYAGRTLTYGATSSSPMSWTPGGSVGAYTAASNGVLSPGGLAFNSVTGITYSNASTVERYVDVMFLVARGRRYQLVVECSSTAADTIPVSVDGVSVGSITCPVNGAGSSNSTVPGTVTLNIPTGIARGARRIRLDMPANTCANAGIFSATLVAY